MPPMVLAITSISSRSRRARIDIPLMAFKGTESEQSNGDPCADTELPKDGQTLLVQGTHAVMVILGEGDVSKRLERYLAFEAGILGPVHHTHGSATEFAKDAIRTDPFRKKRSSWGRECFGRRMEGKGGGGVERRAFGSPCRSPSGGLTRYS